MNTHRHPLRRHPLRRHSLRPTSFPGPEDITRVILPNGITVLSRANFNSPSVVISGYLDVGSLLEPDDRLGLADFTAAALMRGTQARTFQQIYDALESCAASLSFGGGTHSTGFNGKALAEDLELLLAVLSEALRQPVFPAEQVEKLRAQLLTGLAIRAQDTGEMASLVFDQMIYPDHPYSRPDDGFPETVQAITRADLENFHRQNYGPRGMVIAVVGAVDPLKAVDGVTKFLGDWVNPMQPGCPSVPEMPAPQALITQKVAIPGKSQSDILLGAPGPRRRSGDYLAASLGNSVFGQFGMYGRIGDVVREQNGLAYYAYSNLSGGSGPGPWYISAGVNPDNVEKAIELIRAEINRFVTEPVSADELADSQANYIGRLPLSLESNGGVAGALLNLEHYDLGLDYYHRYPGLVQAITPEEALAAARRYLHPDRLGIAIAG